MDLDIIWKGQGQTHPWFHGQQLSKILSWSNMTLRFYGPEMDFGKMCTVPFTLAMTLDQGHDTFFGYGQQLWEILYRSNIAVRSYGPDTDFGYVCTVTFTLEIWP